MVCLTRPTCTDALAVARGGETREKDRSANPGPVRYCDKTRHPQMTRAAGNRQSGRTPNRLPSRHWPESRSCIKSETAQPYGVRLYAGGGGRSGNPCAYCAKTWDVPTSVLCGARSTVSKLMVPAWLTMVPLLPRLVVYWPKDPDRPPGASTGRVYPQDVRYRDALGHVSDWRGWK